MKSNLMRITKNVPAADVENLNDNDQIKGSKAYSIGEKLRMLRQQKDLSIQEVADSLRIGAHYLHAIEDMDRDALPERVYSLGFVRSYSSYLGQDPQESVNQFKQEIYGNYQGEILSLPEPVAEVGRPNWRVIVLCTLIVGAIIFSWYKLSRKTPIHKSETPVITSEDIKTESQAQLSTPQFELRHSTPTELSNPSESSREFFIKHSLNPQEQEQKIPTGESE